MATSSITKNFVVEDEEQQSRQSRSWRCSPNTIEESYQESLTRKEERLANSYFAETVDELDEFTKTRNESNNYESLDGLSYEDLNEETQAAIDEARSLLKSPSEKYYNSAAEVFDDVLGTDWRK